MISSTIIEATACGLGSPYSLSEKTEGQDLKNFYVLCQAWRCWLKWFQILDTVFSPWATFLVCFCRVVIFLSGKAPQMYGSVPISSVLGEIPSRRSENFSPIGINFMKLLFSSPRLFSILLLRTAEKRNSLKKFIEKVSLLLISKRTKKKSFWRGDTFSIFLSWKCHHEKNHELLKKES